MRKQSISSPCFHPENEISVGWRKSPGPGSIVKTNSGPRGARWGRLTANGPSDVGTDAKPKPQILVERLRLFGERIHHSGNRAHSARALDVRRILPVSRLWC